MVTYLNLSNKYIIRLESLPRELDRSSSSSSMSCSRGWWNDLPPDLLVLVAGGLTFQAYTRARAACAAWRAALPAPSSPSLLVLHDDHRERSSFSAWFLSPRISIASLATNLISTGRAQRCVGSGHGWVAFGDFNASLVNVLTGDEITFHSFPEKHGVVMSKVVFAPNPTPAEFTAAAITGHRRVTYTTRGNSGWTDVELPRLGALGGGDYIADVVYHEKEFGGGKKKKVVYCLTGGGDVLVLRLPAGRRRRQRRPASFEPLFVLAADEGSRRVLVLRRGEQRGGAARGWRRRRVGAER